MKKEDRAVEKRAREQDQRDLQSGKINADDLRRKNVRISTKDVKSRWDKAKLY